MFWWKDALGQAYVKAVKAVYGTPYIAEQSSAGLYNYKNWANYFIWSLN